MIPKFFSETFQELHKGQFDVVISRGFIEHFGDAKSVVSKHAALLRDGGILVVMIPNLRGIYRGWTWLFNREQLPMHNLDIMKIDEFKQLFPAQSLMPLHCNHYGTFSFWMFTSPSTSPVRHFIKLLLMIQRPLNLMFRLLFRDKGFESGAFSPDLIFIGRKIPGGSRS